MHVDGEQVVTLGIARTVQILVESAGIHLAFVADAAKAKFYGTVMVVEDEPQPRLR